MLQSRGSVSESQARMLRENGYARLLGGAGAGRPRRLAARRKATSDGRHRPARSRSVARADGDLLDLEQYAGRYLHLLIRQLPNKPVWKLTGEETITWQAAAFDDGARQVLLAFSSLPKAVGFLQPAVLEGLIRDVNKVAKFSRDTAHSWTWAVVLNPTLDSIQGKLLTTVQLDPASAEAPDE